MKKNKPFKICNELIHPGETLSLALPLPEIYSCAPLFMPIKVIHGKKSGPCLLVTAAMHGNELNGTEIINQLFNLKQLKRLSGTLILVPVMNVHALMNRTRHLPGGVDLSQCFPGSPEGTHAARMAHVFIQEIFKLADYAVDLQTGLLNFSNLPQIYVHSEDEEAMSLAKTFNAPVISDITLGEGALSTYALNEGTPLLVYEAGEAMRFDEHAIKVGIRGVLNIMRELKMLPEARSKSQPMQSFHAQENIWIRAASSGISHTTCELGQHVKVGEVVCTIKDPFGAADPITIKSPDEGVIVGKNNLPLVNEGDGLFQLAVFKKMAHAATHLEEWEEKSLERFEDAERA